MKKQLLRTILFSFLAGSFSINLNAQATLISQFDFNGNLNDNLSNGTCTSNNNTSVTFSSGVCSWSADSVNNKSGFSVAIPDAVFTENNYSIAIDFQFAQVIGYKKIIDFGRRGSDQGLYFNSELRLYSVGSYGQLQSVRTHIILYL